MSIEYKEFATEEDFNQCIDLQRSIFNLTDTELISPLLLKLIARNSPPIGISVGVYNITEDKSELIGYSIGLATFLEKSIYTVLMGIKPKFQNNIYGYKLSLKTRDIAIAKGLKCMYCVFDPLEANLARLYINSLGLFVSKYEVDANINSIDDIKTHIPNDKFLAKWDFHAYSTVEKVNGKNRSVKNEDIVNYPIVAGDNMPDIPKVLIEIPNNFGQLKHNSIEQAIKWKLLTRNIFSEYINKRHYIVSDCYTLKIKNNRKTYYLLEKENYHE